jgi:hypothetical protein
LHPALVVRVPAMPCPDTHGLRATDVRAGTQLRDVTSGEDGIGGFDIRPFSIQGPFLDMIDPLLCFACCDHSAACNCWFYQNLRSIMVACATTQTRGFWATGCTHQAVVYIIMVCFASISQFHLYCFKTY